ncbi:ABC transporter substrate-binding protein [Pseudobutyrivibrio xylanivorans]|uniref:ABC transporter substrate-binding protein n=1 Tax=Pseudobutyrivibrio xylanivorans TaxID=185007 RepID=A0A5P6VMD4_PSEXY|nr:ABC transporter substrate-binding protein [Pseudobutyrivibrio xylanivorans]QFJ53717.1 ABC transporter substrate-binding protein [Pseudobutyrivibrio xylanivorans]
MKRKIISGLLAGLMAMSLFTGCGSAANTTTASEGGSDTGAKAEASTSDPITISFWCNFTGSDGDVLREIVDKYNSTNTDNIKVEIDIMDYGTLQSKLPTAISTGTGPSFILAGVELIKQYKENDMIEPIDDFWDVTGIDKSNYNANVLEKSYFDGTQYGVPMQYNLQYLYYNKDLFAAAGLDPEAPPTTMEELEKDAIACTDEANGIYGLGLPVNYGNYVEYLWANGGDVVSVDGKENFLNSDANIKTLTWIQNMINEGVSPKALDAGEADTMFQAGRLAMYTSGPWNINGLNQLGVNYGITAIPAGTDGAFSPEGGCSWMLTKGADEATKQAAYKFMAYWISDDILKEWSNRNGFPVWANSVLKDSEIQANEILADVSAASTIGRDYHLTLDCGSQIDADVMQPMMEKILSGEDVKASVTEASAKLDEVLGL